MHMCDMTSSYVRHDSFICATWLIHMCDMTHSYLWHDSFICATWLIHMCDMTHSCVWHVNVSVCVISTQTNTCAFIRVNEFTSAYMPSTYVRHDSSVRVTRECIHLCRFNTKSVGCVHSREWVYKCIYAVPICSLHSRAWIKSTIHVNECTIHANKWPIHANECTVYLNKCTIHVNERPIHVDECTIDANKYTPHEKLLGI